MDDINDWNTDDNFEYEVEENEENYEFVQTRDVNNEINIKHIDAINCFETCILWSQQNKIDYSKLLVLREIQEEAVQKSLQINQKQTSINEFFKSY